MSLARGRRIGFAAAFVGRGRGLLSRSIDLLRHRNLAAAEVDCVQDMSVGVMGTIDQKRHFVKYDLNLSITYSPDPDPSAEGSMHDKLPL